MGLNNSTAAKTVFTGKHNKPADFWSRFSSVHSVWKCLRSKSVDKVERRSYLADCFSLPFSLSLGERVAMTQQERVDTTPVTGTRLPVPSCRVTSAKKLSNKTTESKTRNEERSRPLNPSQCCFRRSWGLTVLFVASSMQVYTINLKNFLSSVCSNTARTLVLTQINAGATGVSVIS